MAKTKLTPSEHGEIVWALKSSMSLEAIEKKLGVSVDTVIEIRNEMRSKGYSDPAPTIRPVEADITFTDHDIQVQRALSATLMSAWKVLNVWKHPAKDDVAMDMALSDMNNCYAEYQALRKEI